MTSFLKTSAILLGLAACTEPTGLRPERSQPQFASQSQKVTTVLEDFVFPFVADCLGEEVVWSGSARFDDHIVTQSDGSVHVNGQGSLLPGNTITSSSGIWLPVQVRSNYSFELTASGGFRKNMVNERITWRNQITGQLMDVWFRTHVVYTGQGELKRNFLLDHHCDVRK